MHAIHLVVALILSTLSPCILATESGVDAIVSRRRPKPIIQKRSTIADAPIILQGSSPVLPRTIDRFRPDKNRKKPGDEKDKAPQGQHGKAPEERRGKGPPDQGEQQKFRIKTPQQALSLGKSPEEVEAKIANLGSKRGDSPRRGGSLTPKSDDDFEERLAKLRSNKAASPRKGKDSPGEPEDEFKARLDKVLTEKLPEQAQSLKKIESLQPPDLTKSPSVHHTVSYQVPPSLFRPSSLGKMGIEPAPAHSKSSVSSNGGKANCFGCFGSMFKKSRNKRRQLAGKYREIGL